MNYFKMDYTTIVAKSLVFLALLFQICALVLPPYEEEVSDSALWHPPEGSQVKTREEWLRTHGLGDEQFAQLKEKIELIATKQANAGMLPRDANFSHAMHKNEALDGCIKLSEEQADLIIKEAEYESEHNSTKHTRKKRKLYDFRSNPARKWAMPIQIMFDGQHSDYEKHIIRAAFKHWEEGTCVRFEEVPTNSLVQGQYVLITRQPEGCFTFVGKTSTIPQQFNLEYNCLWEFGIPVHEIGHILGLWHEHQREDRDMYIKINWENLGYYESQFYKITTLRLGQTYDYSSVMHYSSKEGSKNGKVTIEATDRRFQSNMGQRIAASFIDKKMINLEYCKNRCYGPEPPCRRDGYQDPNNCYACICPDGFSGPYCQYVDAYKGPEPCGGLVNLNSYREIIINSPGYERGYYHEGQACNWLLKAPQGYRPVMRFEGDFGVYCHLHEQCYHWVEVRTDENLGANGGRYCCYEAPKEQFYAQTDEMLITFRSNYSSRWTPASRGFRMVISTERAYNPAERRPVRNPVESPRPPVPTPAPPPIIRRPELPSVYNRPDVYYPNTNSVVTPKPNDPDTAPYFPNPDLDPRVFPRDGREGTENQNNNLGTPIPDSNLYTARPFDYETNFPQGPTPENTYRPDPFPYRPDPTPYRPDQPPYRPDPTPYKPEDTNRETYRPPSDAPVPLETPRPNYRRPDTPAPYISNTPSPYVPPNPAPFQPETPSPDTYIRRPLTPVPHIPETGRPDTPAPYRPAPNRPETPPPPPLPLTNRTQTPSPFRSETNEPPYRPYTFTPIAPQDPATGRPNTPSPYMPDTLLPNIPDPATDYQPEWNRPDPPSPRETPEPPSPAFPNEPSGPDLHRQPATPSPFQSNTPAPQKHEPDPNYRPDSPFDYHTPSPYVPYVPNPAENKTPHYPPSQTPAPEIPTPIFYTESSVRSSSSTFRTRTVENTVPPVTHNLPSCSVADIALVLDASGSMGLKDYRNVKAFCSDLINQLNIGSETARMGVMTFANRAIIEAHLLKYLRKIDLQYAVNVSSAKREWTNTSGALMVLRKEFFSSKYGDRVERPNIAILVIGGASNLWEEKTLTEAELARQAGIDIYVVGVSNKVDRNELDGITGTPNKVLQVPVYDDLQRPIVLRQTLDMVCSGGRILPSYSWECSFETSDANGPWCGIEQVNFDDFDWTLWSRPTPSAGTGPDEAYHGSFYIYVEATDQKEHEQAIFVIPKANRKGEYCLSFYFHMDGYYVGTLQLFIERPGKERDYPFTVTGDQGEDWINKKIAIVLGRDDQIGFRGVRGEGYLSDIGLDKISLVSGKC